MIKPNIFIIGVQKAGTTSLYHHLRKHPDIFGPSIKDYNNSHPFFTDDNYYREHRGEFEKLFRNNPGVPNVITSEVELIEDIAYLQKIKQYNPDARIIVSLRHPVERLQSMYNFYNQIGRNTGKWDFHQAMEEAPDEYLERSLYFQKIVSLYEIFEKEQVKIILFEDLTGGKFEAVVDEIYSFIGVSPTGDPFIHENKTGTLRFSFLDRLLKMGRGTRFRRFVVRKILDPVFNANKRASFKYRIQKWNLSDSKEKKGNQEVPEAIRLAILQDVEKLSAFLAKDLVSYWHLQE